MELSKSDIAEKHFSKKVFGGLDEFEVRDFLQALAEEVRHLRQLVENQKQQIQDRDERIQEYRDREHILKRSIVSAQEIADKIQKDTEEKSRMIISAANEKSESLVRQARDSLQSVYNDIAGLKRLHLQFKSGLKASLQSQLELLDQTPLFSPSLPESADGGKLSSKQASDESLKSDESKPEDEESLSSASTQPLSSKEDSVAGEEDSKRESDAEERSSASDDPEDGESADSLETLKQSLQSLEKDFL